MLYLRAMQWLPGSPAHAAGLATALLGAAAALALHAACRAWGARPLAATFAVAIYATGPIVLRLMIEAEGFAGNQLVVATVLWLAARGGPARGGWRVGLLALVAGCGLSNHVTCVAIAPVGVLGAVRGVRESSRQALAALAGVGALIVGLAPYAYLFVAPSGGASWSSIDSVGDLLHHVLREDFGGATAFAPHGEAVPVAVNLGAFATMLGRAWLWLPIAAGAAGFALGMHGPARDGESRIAWVLLAASWLIAGPLLVARFNLRPEGLEYFVVNRFYVLSALLLAVPIACGLDRAAAWLAPRVRVSASLAARAGVLATVAAIVLAAANISTALGKLGRVDSAAVEDAVGNTLHSMPHGALLIVSEDELASGASYFQDALSDRTDVVVLMWGRVAQASYRERFERRVGFTVPRGPRSSIELAESALRSGYPVFVDIVQQGILSDLPSYPYGIVFRVLPRGAQVPSALDQFTQNKQLFGMFVLDYQLPTVDDELATHYQDKYAQTWRILARQLDRAGNRAEADEARAFETALEPRPSD